MDIKFVLSHNVKIHLAIWVQPTFIYLPTVWFKALGGDLTFLERGKGFLKELN